MKSRWIILVFWGVLLVALGVLVNRTVDTELEEVNLRILSTGKTPSIPVEEGVFKGSYLAKRFSKMNIEGHQAGRSMEDYYSRRAYPGAYPHTNYYSYYYCVLINRLIDHRKTLSAPIAY